MRRLAAQLGYRTVYDMRAPSLKLAHQVSGGRSLMHEGTRVLRT